MLTNILIADDDRTVCAALRLLLKRSGFNTFDVHRPVEILPCIEEKNIDLILLDMNFTIDTSGRKGLQLLQQIQEKYDGLPIILMTGWATVQLAVEGMKLGAKDFIAKPWDNKHLISSIKTILALQKTRQTNDDLSGFEHIIGEAPSLLSVVETAKMVSKTDASVLILGESGTGKELFAEAIHYESLRTNNPFIKVNLGGISQTLFESEMFGHKKGAFTDAHIDRKGRFELANSGTIFLDEIGDLAPSSQVKLLRVLQERTFEALGSSTTQKVDVRVISATNKNLEQMVSEGAFREDLFYRINLIKLRLPSLRERKSDIPLLVKHFVNNLKVIYEKEDLEVTRDALQWLSHQTFPGNIRALKNLVERTVLITPNNKLTTAHFQHQYAINIMPSGTTNLPSVGSISLAEIEIQMIKKALNFYQHSISQTARALGISRSSLYRRLEKYKIPYEPKI